jgi:hypothetical protein
MVELVVIREWTDLSVSEILRDVGRCGEFEPTAHLHKHQIVIHQGRDTVVLETS